MKALADIRRVELQFLALNAGVGALLLVILNTLGNILQLRVFNRFSIILVFASSALTAWALLFHRVFNAREVLVRIGQRATFILVLSGGIYLVWRTTSSLLPEPFDLLFSIGICSSAAVWLDRKSRSWFERSSQRKLAKLRRAVIDAGRVEPDPERLVTHLESLLREASQTHSAALLLNNGQTYVGTEFPIAKTRPGFAALCEIGWATPESLQRRRPSPVLEDLQQFLRENALGVVVTAPRNSPTPSLLVALGTKSSDWPFTYPDVERLQNVADLIDSTLKGSRLVAQAALQARLEYLAMMSRGLAHDLKNLITPLATFLVHTDNQFHAGSPEAEVHAAARRSVRIMTEYVRDALFFSDRLQPCYEQVGLARILRGVVDATQSRASQRGVTVEIRNGYDEIITADGILLERMLANLVGNAIDASSNGQTVVLSSSNGRVGWVRFQVKDEGSGIAPDNLGRIFEPYFTTKKYGDELRGFGLGLTISQKIADLHRGVISVASQLGRGTTATVDLPTAPES